MPDILIRAIYGRDDGEWKDVTKQIQTTEVPMPVLHLRHGQAAAGKRRHLRLSYAENLAVNIDDGGLYTPPAQPPIQPVLLSSVLIKEHRNVYVYYHVFATAGPGFLALLTEQLAMLKLPQLYLNVSEIRCCVSGNDNVNYETALQMIRDAGARFTVLRNEFGDKWYERFTLHTLARGVIESEAMYFYLHSKGTTREAPATKDERNPVRDWRQCMQYFLIERADQCLWRLASGLCDVVGIMYHPDFHEPHYSGNFWWATGAYLQKLSQVCPIIGLEYNDPETWLFKAYPRYCNLFPLTRNHYQQTISRQEYSNVEL